jgi:hypothetical protein
MWLSDGPLYDSLLSTNRVVIDTITGVGNNHRTK